MTRKLLTKALTRKPKALILKTNKAHQKRCIHLQEPSHETRLLFFVLSCFDYSNPNAANSFAALVTARSIGKRSVDEPVQKPCPDVLFSINCASAGFSIAAPCATRITSGCTLRTSL